MTDEESLVRETQRARDADALLRNQLLTGAFATLEHDYIEAWQMTAARDTDARERLWQAVQVVGKVKAHLQAAISDGKLAAEHLRQLATLTGEF